MSESNQPERLTREWDDKPAEMWAVVELFGHRKIAGRISEQTIGGNAFLRIDVPEVEGIAAHTKLYGNGAIYSLGFTTKEIAVEAAKQIREAPVSVYDFTDETRRRLQALPAPAKSNRPDDLREDDFDGDGEFEDRFDGIEDDGR